MRSLSLKNIRPLFHGHITLEETPVHIQPWRLDFPQRLLFGEKFQTRAMDAAGVRLAMKTTAVKLHLTVDPRLDLRTLDQEDQWQFDLLVDGQLHEQFKSQRQPCTLRFDHLPPGWKLLEVYLPLMSPVAVREIAINDDAVLEPFNDPRPRWLSYGSSITQCRTALSPSQSWPALVARQFDLNLTCMGYGGSCHLEPMVARIIRDQPADYLTLCLGINVKGHSSYSPRTFDAAVIGMIKTIRDKQPRTPVIVISPIYSQRHETTPNAVGLNLVSMRALIRQAVDSLVALGDEHLRYVDGLSIFGPEHDHHMPDHLHPDGQGYLALAQRFGQVVMPHFNLSPKGC